MKPVNKYLIYNKSHSISIFIATILNYLFLSISSSISNNINHKFQSISILISIFIHNKFQLISSSISNNINNKFLLISILSSIFIHNKFQLISSLISNNINNKFLLISILTSIFSHNKFQLISSSISNNINHKFLLFSIFLLSSILIQPTSTFAQDSLSSYLKIAEENNPGIKAKTLEYSAAMEKIPQVGSLPDPQIDAGFYLQPMAQIDGNLLASFKLMQMFPWFGTLKAAKDEMSKMALAKMEEVRNEKNKLFLNVKTSYYEVYRTKKNIEIISKNIEILRTIERLALVKYKAGDATSSANTAVSSDTKSSSSGTDNTGSGSGSSMGGMSAGNSTAGNTGNAGMGGMSQSAAGSMGGGTQNSLVNLFKIQIEIGSLEEQIEQLKEQLIADKVKFNSYLNRPSNAEVYVSDSIADIKLSKDFSLLADSLINNPMVKMYETDKTAYEAKIKMISKMGYPMIGAGIDYSVFQKREGSLSGMNGADMVMPMLTVTLPIYRKKYNAQRKEAEFMRDASQEFANNMKNELKVNFQDAVKQYTDATRKINLYKKQSELTDKSITLLISSYTAAGGDFDEILRMQQQNIDFQLKNMEAVVSKNIAIATIESIISRQ